MLKEKIKDFLYRWSIFLIFLINFIFFCFGRYWYIRDQNTISWIALFLIALCVIFYWVAISKFFKIFKDKKTVLITDTVFSESLTYPSKSLASKETNCLKFNKPIF